MKKKLIVLLAILLYLLIVISSNVYADDNFIYGVQIFNRPIDWYWDSYNHSKEAGTEAVKQMISYAAELNADLVRGGLQYSNMYSQLKRDGEKDMWGLKLLLPLLAEKNLMLDWVISGTDSNLGMTNPLSDDTGQNPISDDTGNNPASDDTGLVPPSSDDTPVPPSIVTVQGDIVSGKFGEQYRLKLNSDTEGVKWILEYNSSLPEGLSLDENTGIISGIPKETGSFKFSVYAEKDGLSSDSETFTITIDYAGKIAIITSQEDFDDNECIEGSAYYLELETIPESVSWDIYSGNFPSEFDKFSLRNSGRIWGVPSRAGRYNFTLIASLEGYESASREFTLNVQETPSIDPAPPAPSTGGVSGGSGGGCSSGFGAVCALTAILLLKRK